MKAPGEFAFPRGKMAGGEMAGGSQTPFPMGPFENQRTAVDCLVRKIPTRFCT